MNYADDGFGNLVSIEDPYAGQPKTVKLFARLDGELATFESDASDHESAIYAARQALGHRWDSRKGRYREGPVLALIEGGLPSPRQEVTA